MPSPTETLLRVQVSPVPIQTTLVFFGSIRIAPIDWFLPSVSNIGLKVSAPSSDFQAPPDAAPTHTVRRSPAAASMAAMRPLMTAGPRARASRPPRESESTLISRAGSAAAALPARASAARPTQRILDAAMSRLLLFGRRFFSGSRHLEAVVGDRRVELDHVDADLLFLGVPLRSAFKRVRNEHASDVLVVTDRLLG